MPSVVTAVSQAWSSLATWAAAHVVEPAIDPLHLAGRVGDPLDIARAGMIAGLQILIIAGIFRPLEALAPAERWADRRLTRVDRHYTLLMLLGVFPLFAYLVLTPVSHLFGGDATSTGALFDVRHLVPWLGRHPVLLFLVYYVVYDFTYYWMHRAQHALPWWWALHSMHHSQRQMSCWTNDRGNYVDGALQSFILAGVGLAMGVDPEQFALLVLVGELVQNLSHANVRIGFGRVLERVFVDPRFHRLHHMRVDPDRPTLHDCNFGQVLALWDMLFGTALYGEPVRPTGVGDPVVDADNDHGVVGMQWWSFRRFWATVRTRAGWTPGRSPSAPTFARCL